MPPNPPFDPPCDAACSVASHAAGEPLLGTAPSVVETWILLEHRQPWAGEAPKRSDLSPQTWQHLKAITRHLPSPKILFIRNPRLEGPLSLIVCGVAPNPSTYSVALKTPDDILGLPPLPAPDAVSGDWPEVVREPIFVVCTHGKRDPCCAKEGLPLFRALLNDSPPRTVWQCTHLGGHRFAPTLLVLPAGYCYGRFPLDLAPDLLESFRAQRLAALPYLRGRTCFSPEAQAADVTLRQRLGLTRLDALSAPHTAPNPAQASRWLVTFAQKSTPSPLSHTLDVSRVVDPSVQIPTSCNTSQTTPRAWFEAKIL